MLKWLLLCLIKTWGAICPDVQGTHSKFVCNNKPKYCYSSHVCLVNINHTFSKLMCSCTATLICIKQRPQIPYMNKVKNFTLKSPVACLWHCMLGIRWSMSKMKTFTHNGVQINTDTTLAPSIVKKKKKGLPLINLYH